MLFRTHPTKDDVDVFRAIETTPVSPDDYPHLSKWREAMLSFSEEDRNKLVYIIITAVAGALQNSVIVDQTD